MHPHQMIWDVGSFYITYEGNIVFKIFLLAVWLPSTQSCLLISSCGDTGKMVGRMKYFPPFP